MLTCYIIDDEQHAINNLTSYVNRTPTLQLLGCNENPLAALTYLQDLSSYPDIIFLDIEMPQLSGIEVSAMLKDKAAIVLTTAYPNFAIEAFEIGISDYLLKPFSYERFIKSIYKIGDLLTKSKNRNAEFFYIQAETKGKVIRISTKDILYIEAQKNYLSIVTPLKKILTYLTLTEMSEKVPTNFLRINKSYIINTDKISHVEGNEVFLANVKESLHVGPGYKESFLGYMKEHLLKTKR